MTGLDDQLKRLIHRHGPISIATFMGEALGNPDHGYYMTQDAFGTAGDFITAPEVSQIFGELIGLWMADYWQRMGAPEKIAIVELGPGRGTLMSDALRAMKTVPGLMAAAEIHLVETSQRLQIEQRNKLTAIQDIAGIADILWHNHLSDALHASGTIPLLIVANEFFDALPIQQFIKQGTRWHERLVGVDKATGKFMPMLSPEPSAAAAMLPDHVKKAPSGSLAEICTSGLAIADEMAKALPARKGAALVIDYGYGQSQPGDSLQAVRAHKYTAVFEAPGTADITAHVNFAALARAAVPSTVFGPMEQGNFLKALGIDIRAQALCRGATPEQVRDIKAAVERLCAPDQMGSLFKVMALTSPDGPTPAGFEPAGFEKDT